MERTKAKDKAMPEFTSKKSAVEWAYEKLDELGEKADVTLVRKEVLGSKSQTRLIVFAYIPGGWVWGRVFFDIDEHGTYVLDEVKTMADGQATPSDEGVPTFTSLNAASAWARQKVRELHSMMGVPLVRVVNHNSLAAWQLTSYGDKAKNVDLIIVRDGRVWKPAYLNVHMQN